MQRLYTIDILAWSQGCGKLAEACRETSVDGDARDAGVRIEFRQGLKDMLRIAEMGEDMHLMGDASETTGLGLKHIKARVGWPFSYPNLRQRRRRAPLRAEMNDLLAYLLQQLLGDIAPVPHTSHRDPFLGFRHTRSTLRY
jgi:hypothetical protein